MRKVASITDAPYGGKSTLRQILIAVMRRWVLRAARRPISASATGCYPCGAADDSRAAAPPSGRDGGNGGVLNQARERSCDTGRNRPRTATFAGLSSLGHDELCRGQTAPRLFANHFQS